MSWEVLLTGGALTDAPLVESSSELEPYERELKEFEGTLVEVHGLAEELKPNSETKEAVGGAAIGFNGKCGRALRWDEEEQKYIVQTFDGLIAGIPEENLQDYEPPDPLDGGFDIAWPTGSAAAYGLFAGMVGECLSTKGYCVVQMFTNEAICEGAVEESKSMVPFEHLRAEFMVGYLGDDNITKASQLEVDTPDKELLDALSHLTETFRTWAHCCSPWLRRSWGATSLAAQPHWCEHRFLVGRCKLLLPCKTKISTIARQRSSWSSFCDESYACCTL
jgi:hypothetical protein